jgi:hypothetical protein
MMPKPEGRALVVLQDVFQTTAIAERSFGQQSAPRVRVGPSRETLGRADPHALARCTTRPTQTCFAPVTYSLRDKPAAAAATSGLTPMPSRRQNASAV